MSIDERRRASMHTAGSMPYNETPPNKPASSKATRKMPGNAYARMTGGPIAKTAARIRDLYLSDNAASSSSILSNGLSFDKVLKASWKKSTSETDAPAMLDPIAQNENISTRSVTTGPPT